MGRVFFYLKYGTGGNPTSKHSDLLQYTLQSSKVTPLFCPAFLTSDDNKCVKGRVISELNT